MPQRRDPADRKPGDGAHPVGVGALQVQPLGVDGTVAGAQDHDRLAVTQEHERLDDLADLDTQRLRGQLRGAGGV